MRLWKLCFCVYFIIFLDLVSCFNVDSFNYATYKGPDYSMFGFSLTLHKESGRGWLVVGAPEAQARYPPNVYRGGAVYRCPVDRDEGCQEIIFDTQDQRLNAENQPYDNRTEQWFGATVTGSGSENGPIVACAPRYSWYPYKGQRDPVGTCWVSNGHFNEFNEYSPCRTFWSGYHRQGSCQAGFSAAIDTRGDRLYVGAPGSWFWTGQMYSIDAKAKLKYTPASFSAPYGAEDQIISKGSSVRPTVIATPKGSDLDFISYMGYSTVVGDFLGDKEKSIAVGMPRGNELKGQVLLFTWNLTNIFYDFTSDQLGSYYGYALAASDIDGDGKDDLIVGAPMYTPVNSEGKYDVGRVYVIYQNSASGKYTTSSIIDGFNSRSRFGQALSTLGDINQDGVEDFAIGAPYDGPNQRGAVYIYHGSRKGIREKYSQVIFAEDVVVGPSAFLNTFGFSITGGLDLDGNQYPDMAVGAYASNHAFYFRSRPVVIVDAQARFRTSKKEIDIKIGNYKLHKGGTASVTSIDFCIKYRGKGIPQYIDLDLQYILDTHNPKFPRMGFVENENTNILNDTIRLIKDRPETCITKEVFVKTNIKDKLTPLEAEVKYWMKDQSRSQLYQTRDPRAELKPVLDLNSPPSRKDSISIHKNCGPDNICIPDLSLTVKPNVEQYSLGSTDKLTFDVLVSNNGEDSFETILEVKYPPNIYFLRKEEQYESKVLCNTYENNILKCELGNPIPQNKIVDLKIFWQPDIKEGMAPSYEFDLLVNSTNQELSNTFEDNQAHISISIKSNSTLDLTGKSHPDEVYFNSSQYTTDIGIMYENIPFEKRLNEKDIGPQVTHVYYLQNKGPATIKETEVFFIWPSATVSGDDFVYLLEPPHFSPSNNIQCDPILSNRLNFNIDQYQKSIWERLGLDVSEIGIASHRIGSSVGGQGYQYTGTQYQTSGSQFSGNRFSSSGSQRGNQFQTGGGKYQGGEANQYGTRQHQSSISQSAGTTGTQYGTVQYQTTNYKPDSRQYQSGGTQYGRGQYHSRGGTAQQAEGQYQTGIFQQGGGQQGSTGGIVTYSRPGPVVTKTSTKYYTTQDGVTKVSERNKTEVKNSTGTFVKYDNSGDLNQGGYKPGTIYSSGGYGLNSGVATGTTYQTAGRQYQNTTRDQSIYSHGAGSSGRPTYYGGSREHQVGGITGLRTYQSGSTGYQQGVGQGQVHYQQNTQIQRPIHHREDEARRTYVGGQTVGVQHYGTSAAQSGSSESHFQQAGTSTGHRSAFQGGAAAHGYAEEEEEEGHSITGYYDKNGNYIAHGQEGLSTRQQVSQTQSGLEGAALGTNFGITTLDLGRMGAERHPVTEIHRKEYVAEVGGEGDIGSSFRAGTNSGSQGANTERRTEWKQETHWSQSQPIPPTYFNTLERTNVPTDQSERDQRYYGRKKRDTNDPYAEISSIYPCKAVRCSYMRCLVGALEKDKTITIALRSRINARVLRNISSQQGTNFSSIMAARISKLPYIRQPIDQHFYMHEVTTTVLPQEPDLTPNVVPLWVVILSAVAGTIILLLLVFLLYKLGFFKRNRPSRAPERQPLRNGYHRDEAL